MIILKPITESSGLLGPWSARWPPKAGFAAGIYILLRHPSTYFLSQSTYFFLFLFFFYFIFSLFTLFFLLPSIASNFFIVFFVFVFFFFFLFFLAFSRWNERFFLPLSGVFFTLA